MEAIFWLRSAIKFYEYYNPLELERVYTVLGLINLSKGDKILAEGLFKKSLEMLDEVSEESFNLG